MAKHPHRLIYIDKKLWRCTLAGCSFFVHTGLAYVLPGKQAMCWDCDETFILGEAALKDDMPKCPRCRGISFAPKQSSEVVTPAILDDIDALTNRLMKEGVPTKSEPVEDTRFSFTPDPPLAVSDEETTFKLNDVLPDEITSDEEN